MNRSLLERETLHNNYTVYNPNPNPNLLFIYFGMHGHGNSCVDQHEMSLPDGGQMLAVCVVDLQGQGSCEAQVC